VVSISPGSIESHTLKSSP